MCYISHVFHLPLNHFLFSHLKYSLPTPSFTHSVHSSHVFHLPCVPSPNQSLLIQSFKVLTLHAINHSFCYLSCSIFQSFTSYSINHTHSPRHHSLGFQVRLPTRRPLPLWQLKTHPNRPKREKRRRKRRRLHLPLPPDPKKQNPFTPNPSVSSHFSMSGKDVESFSQFWHGSSFRWRINLPRSPQDARTVHLLSRFFFQQVFVTMSIRLNVNRTAVILAFLHCNYRSKDLSGWSRTRSKAMHNGSKIG